MQYEPVILGIETSTLEALLLFFAADKYSLRACTLLAASMHANCR